MHLNIAECNVGKLTLRINSFENILNFWLKLTSSEECIIGVYIETSAIIGFFKFVRRRTLQCGRGAGEMLTPGAVATKVHF